MNAKIAQMISEYEDDGFFTYASPSDDMLCKAQQLLSVKLPNQFVAFLKAYGHGGIGGVEILGYGLDGSAAFVEETLEYRTHGLPDNLIVVENVDEWVYCIASSTGEVVSWNEANGERPAFSNFDDFVVSEFSDAIENL